MPIDSNQERAINEMADTIDRAGAERVAEATKIPVRRVRSAINSPMKQQWHVLEKLERAALTLLESDNATS